MPVTCDTCDQTSNRFSRSEYRGGKRSLQATCQDCEREIARCVECAREFSSHSWTHALNQLKMHRQTHAPRTFACPVCNGSKRFKTGADTALHLESGYCTGCQGKDNAHQVLNPPFVCYIYALNPYSHPIPHTSTSSRATTTPTRLSTTS
jgi:hypothetical protein